MGSTDSAHLAHLEDDVGGNQNKSNQQCSAKGFSLNLPEQSWRMRCSANESLDEQSLDEQSLDEQSLDEQGDKHAIMQRIGTAKGDLLWKAEDSPEGC